MRSKLFVPASRPELFAKAMASEADMIEKALAAALDRGLRTADIKSEGMSVVSTAQMGDAILAELEAIS